METELSDGAKRMLELLKEGPRTVAEVAQVLRRDQSRVRSYLRELQAAGLARRDGGPGAWGKVCLSRAIISDPQSPPTGRCLACGDTTARGRKNKDGTRQLTGHYCPACKQALRADHVLFEAACVLARRRLTRTGERWLDMVDVSSLHIRLGVPLWGDPEAPTREGKQGLVSWLVSRGLVEPAMLRRRSG